MSSSQKPTSSERTSAAYRGVVIEVKPKTLYGVRLEDGRVVTAGIKTSARHVISRLVVGEKVLLELSQNDPTRGHVTQKVS